MVGLFAGIGISHLVSFAAAKLLGQRGLETQLVAEVGLVGFEPPPGDPYIFSAGSCATSVVHTDFVHTLAVEGVVHHLDLTLEVPSPGLSDDAYGPVVEVLAGLLGTELPSWDLDEAVLKGTGRVPLSDRDRATLGDEAERFPLFG